MPSTLDALDAFGFTPADRAELQNAFKSDSHIQKVILFGSRSRGNFKPGSDVDLALFVEGDGFRAVSSLKNRLEQGTGMPYFFDIVDYGTLSDPNLKEEIDRGGKVIYEKATT